MRKLGKLSIGGTLVALGIASALAGCSPESADTSAPIRIGSLHPLTGDSALEGQGMDVAVKMAVEDINKSGGIDSLDGRKLQVLSADTKGDPSVGQTATQGMLEKNVSALIGAFNSSVTTNVATTAERGRVPLIIDVAALTSAMPPDSKYVYRLQPTGSAFGRDGARFLHEIADANGDTVESVAILHEKSNYGSDVADAFEEVAGEIGIEVKLRLAYDAFAVTDMTTELTKVRADGVDALVVAGYYADGVLIAKNAAAVKPQLKAVFGVAQAAYVEETFPGDAPNASEGVFGVNYHYDATSPAVTELRNRFMDRTGQEMRTTAVYAYQSVLVLADALERAASDKPADIAEALRETDLEQELLAFEGNIKFGLDGENDNARATVMQVQEGLVPQVYPESVAESKPRWGELPW